MNHEDAVKIYLPIGGALLGLIAIYITHYFTKRRENLSRFHSAATKFRDAFAPELAAAEADTEHKINYMEFLRTAYTERHSQALILFEPFVAIEKRKSLLRDWKRYLYGEQADSSIWQSDQLHMDYESLLFLEYSIEFDLSKPERPRTDAINRMRQLMSYASPTLQS